jgi:hypothetical protein
MADIHVYPVDDAIPHDTESRGCWCQPTLDEECDTVLVIHHSADGRELDESDALPPARRH